MQMILIHFGVLRYPDTAVWLEVHPRFVLLKRKIGHLAIEKSRSRNICMRGINRMAKVQSLTPHLRAEDTVMIKQPGNRTGP